MSLKEDGKEIFHFIVNPQLICFYKAEYLNEITINPNDVLHFCSVDLVESNMKEAHKAMVNKFKSANATIVLILMFVYLFGKMLKHVKKQYMNFTES